MMLVLSTSLLRALSINCTVKGSIVMLQEHIWILLIQLLVTLSIFVMILLPTSHSPSVSLSAKWQNNGISLLKSLWGFKKLVSPTTFKQYPPQCLLSTHSPGLQALYPTVCSWPWKLRGPGPGLLFSESLNLSLFLPSPSPTPFLYVCLSLGLTGALQSRRSITIFWRDNKTWS